MFFDPPRNKTSLAIGVGRLKIKDPFPARIRRPKLFLFLIYVSGDYRVRGVENGLRRTVILFEQNDLRIREGVLEFKNVSNVRLPKSVDALRIVPYYANILLLLGQVLYHRELQRIRILIFIDQNVLVPLVV